MQVGGFAVVNTSGRSRLIRFFRFYPHELSMRVTKGLAVPEKIENKYETIIQESRQ